MSETLLLALGFVVVAAIYSSVGHAGASGYLATMALVGVAPERMKPTALLLNIVVGLIAVVNFRRAGVFFPRAVLPFAVGSIPMAFLGGAYHPASSWYRPLVAVVLAFAAVRLFIPRAKVAGTDASAEPYAPWLAAVPMGACIGLLAGLTGTGGGIFLTPLLVWLGWAGVRQSAGISALFILVNSVAGLAGNATIQPALTPETAVLALAAGVGGFVGSWLGANRIPERPLAILLGVVLLIASAKLAFS